MNAFAHLRETPLGSETRGFTNTGSRQIYVCRYNEFLITSLPVKSKRARQMGLLFFLFTFSSFVDAKNSGCETRAEGLEHTFVCINDILPTRINNDALTMMMQYQGIAKPSTYLL